MESRTTWLNNDRRAFGSLPGLKRRVCFLRTIGAFWWLESGVGSATNDLRGLTSAPVSCCRFLMESRAAWVINDLRAFASPPVLKRRVCFVRAIGAFCWLESRVASATNDLRGLTSAPVSFCIFLMESRAAWVTNALRTFASPPVLKRRVCFVRAIGAFWSVIHKDVFSNVLRFDFRFDVVYKGAFRDVCAWFRKTKGAKHPEDVRYFFPREDGNSVQGRSLIVA
jgi:hypothetical protein